MAHFDTPGEVQMGHDGFEGLHHARQGPGHMLVNPEAEPGGKEGYKHRHHNGHHHAALIGGRRVFPLLLSQIHVELVMVGDIGHRVVGDLLTVAEQVVLGLIHLVFSGKLQGMIHYLVVFPD